MSEWARKSYISELGSGRREEGPGACGNRRGGGLGPAVTVKLMLVILAHVYMAFCLCIIINYHQGSKMNWLQVYKLSEI